MADGSNLLSGDVNRETISLDIAYQRHHKEITFDVVRMANHHIILGAPWLRKQNPIIDWKIGVLTFRETDNVISSEHTHRQRSVVYEETSGRTTAECNTVTSNKDDLIRGSDSMDISKGSAG